MEKWPVGVFTSVDAGLGVDLAVARELNIPTIQIHAPHIGNRDEAAAAEIQKRLDTYGIKATAVFGGFEGESYADIPTCLLYTSPSPRDLSTSRMPSSS